VVLVGDVLLANPAIILELLVALHAVVRLQMQCEVIPLLLQILAAVVQEDSLDLEVALHKIIQMLILLLDQVFQLGNCSEITQLLLLLLHLLQHQPEINNLALKIITTIITTIIKSNL
jgi:hypothetical protein